VKRKELSRKKKNLQANHFSVNLFGKGIFLVLIKI